MTKRKAGANVLAALVFGLICYSAALADETIQIGQSAAVLLRPNSPVGSVILMPGGDGSINPGPSGEIN
ncbi:MAG: alpha/beta hydrolase, partial [Xanthobacteraceae bacterium]